MRAGQVLRVRNDLDQEECNYIGVCMKDVQGYRCRIAGVTHSGISGYRDIRGDCTAVHVKLLDGPDAGGTWWMPPSFFTTVCMFGDEP